jgi:hypothetical protein
MNFLQALNSDISVLIVCNKTGGTIKGDIKKKRNLWLSLGHRTITFCPVRVQFSYTFHFIDERLVVPKRLRLDNTRRPTLYHVTRPEFAEKDRTPVGPLFIPQSFAKEAFRLVFTKASR